MSDYTPSTAEVRGFYGQESAHGDNFEQRIANLASGIAEFDRWLAAHAANDYQRGRDTASDAVDDFAYPMLQRGEITKEQYTGLIAAARWDGEQA